MTNIDLTPTNEAAARELFAADNVARLEECLSPEIPPETKASMMNDVREISRDSWNSGQVHPMVKLEYRERALAVLLVTHKDIARQAWNHCADQVEAFAHKHGVRAFDARQNNPYDPEQEI